MAKKQTIYTEPLKGGNRTIGDLMTIRDFRAQCKALSFIDSDGHGYPVKNKKLAPLRMVHPSKCRSIPKDATHILWFNK